MSDIQKVITAHRAVADLLEAHPDFDPPLVLSSGIISWSLYDWNCPDGIPAAIAAIRRTVGGKWAKREQVSYGGQSEMVFERDGYMITVKREAVCTRRVVGTRTKTLPAVEAQPECTVEEEIVEWDCEPILEQVSA